MYSYHDLEQNHLEYEKNFTLLENAKGVELKKYLKRERELDELSKKILRDIRRQDKLKKIYDRI